MDREKLYMVCALRSGDAKCFIQAATAHEALEKMRDMLATVDPAASDAEIYTLAPPFLEGCEWECFNHKGKTYAALGHGRLDPKYFITMEV